MKEGTSPGPDDFTVNFFHHFWEMIEMDVQKIVDKSRISGRIPTALNTSFLTLIPKSEGVDTPDKF